jgi:LPXTG-motif cell wall-anchored protein
MEQHVFSRRRAAGGLACVAAGAMALALGAAPAAATGGPEVDTGPGWSADQLSEQYGGEWMEVEVPFESGRYELGDGAFVEVDVEGDQFSWSASGQEIGAVEVEGDGESNLYTYGGGHGSRNGHGLSRPDRGDRGDRGHGDWGGGGGWGGGRGHKISFCWKKPGHGGPPPTHVPPPTHGPPPTHVPPTVPPTTAPPETTVPPTTAPPETTVPPSTPTTLPETEATTPTTQPVGEQLPRTGNNTLPLVVGGVLLVALGGGAFAGRRYLQQRAS